MKQLLFIALAAIVLAGCKKEETKKDCAASSATNFTTSQTDSTFSIKFTGDLSFGSFGAATFWGNDTSYTVSYTEMPTYLRPDTQYVFAKSKLQFTSGGNKPIPLPFHIDSGGWNWSAFGYGGQCSTPTNYQPVIIIKF